MSGPPPGKYVLEVALGPRPSIGSDFVGPPVAPVVVGGPNTVWTVLKSQDGNYTLCFQEGIHRYAREEYGNVVVNPEKRPSDVWSIREQEGGFYTIEVPNTTRGWTLYDAHPNSFVAVGYINNQAPELGQLWKFHPR
ncbi:hypothetical protein OG21DRAFT_1517535 [Imleria badia]|nr:hypothetical protein OG21DRAFT_1517535 [Imleria badia]